MEDDNIFDDDDTLDYIFFEEQEKDNKQISYKKPGCLIFLLICIFPSLTILSILLKC